jgi:hypothetical protein
MSQGSYIQYVVVTRIGGKEVPPMECRLLVRGGVLPGEFTYAYETFCNNCNSRVDHGEHYVMRSYGETYCAGCVEWEERGYGLDGRKILSRRKKDILLKMAADGETRPRADEEEAKIDEFTHKQLHRALRNYTDPDHMSYDKDFDETMRVLQPDWFKRRRPKDD